MGIFIEKQKVIDTKCVIQAVNDLLPESPLYVYRMHNLVKAAQIFLQNFKGQILYAVKSNADPVIIDALYNMGINRYDVASIGEIIKLKRLIPDSILYFMHPVKSREAIRKAYFEYGVRDFSIDSFSELMKVVEETKQANDIKFHIRMAVPNIHSEHKLSNKFGATENVAISLLIESKKYTKDIGLCFHVGTQCMNPDAYRTAIRLASYIIKKSRVEIRTLDVGGGFPAVYPGYEPPSLTSYFDAIYEECHNYQIKCELLCEPGRALVAASGAVIVRVELRKNNYLYINDGVYGNLSECSGILGHVFPVRLIPTRDSQKIITKISSFSFFGPTCDSLDFMEGPFVLPDDIQSGDYIEIGQTGAYGQVLATNFNGFSTKDSIFTDDK